MQMKTFFLCVVCALSSLCGGFASKNEIEVLDLDVFSYERFTANNPKTVQGIVEALHAKGIVGIRGVPGYVEKLEQFVKQARSFCALPEEVKELYAPRHDLGETFLGYEKGKEKFKRTDGKWVVDDLKVSYYAYVPENEANKWLNKRI